MLYRCCVEVEARLLDVTAKSIDSFKNGREAHFRRRERCYVTQVIVDKRSHQLEILLTQLVSLFIYRLDA